MPIEDDMDVNGWDLGKAIKLMLKGNTVVTDWLQSHIIYHGDEQLRNEMLALADACAERTSFMRHYYHLGTQQWQRFLVMGKEAPAKKLFYSARPALCLRWLRVNGDRKIPPMNFQILLEQAATPSAISAEFELLIAAKALTRELGNTSISDDVREFIDGEYQLVEPLLIENTIEQSLKNIEMARTIFRSAVMRYSPE